MPRCSAEPATRLSDAASPRTITAIAGRDPGPGTRTRDQRSASAQRTHRWQQSPQRDFAEKSSRFVTAASKVAPYISRPWTEPPQSQASEARHESWMRPKVGFLYSSGESDRAGRDQFLAAQPYDAISNAKTF